MPSTTSSSVSSDLASSTVMTPSLPTFFMASARNLPISASPLAEMVPTWAISSFEVTFLEFLTRSATTASTARSIPRFRSIGFMPAATALAPSRTMAAAHTGAGVGPSPAARARLGDAGSADRLVEYDVATLGAERHLDGVGENVDAAQHAIAGIDAEFDF